MKRPALLMAAAGLALLYCAGANRHVAADEEPAVLAQDLKKLRVPGKVSAVLWTRRSDSFTLQVLVPRSSMLPMRALQAKPQDVKAQPRQYPQIQVWLLRSDGTHIPFTRRIETPEAERTCMRCIGSEVSYSFPLSASSDAVAAAIRIDDDYYIDRLTPFED